MIISAASSSLLKASIFRDVNLSRLKGVILYIGIQRVNVLVRFPFIAPSLPDGNGSEVDRIGFRHSISLGNESEISSNMTSTLKSQSDTTTRLSNSRLIDKRWCIVIIALRHLTE